MQWILQDLNIGQNLRILRQQHLLSQAQLVAQMQILGSAMSDVTAYNKIERGYRNIRVSDLVILSKIYHCSFDDFFQNLG